MRDTRWALPQTIAWERTEDVSATVPQAETDLAPGRFQLVKVVIDRLRVPSLSRAAWAGFCDGRLSAK